jgi:hypothetical protein
MLIEWGKKPRGHHAHQDGVDGTDAWEEEAQEELVGRHQYRLNAMRWFWPCSWISSRSFT